MKRCCASLTSHDLFISAFILISFIVVMEKGACEPGLKWDSLLKQCISLETMGLTPSGEWHFWADLLDQCKVMCFYVELDAFVVLVVPPPVVKSVMSTRGPDESWPTIGPSMWICVSLVMSGSVLVLLLLFIIYRRHSRTSQNTGKIQDYIMHYHKSLFQPMNNKNTDSQSESIRL